MDAAAGMVSITVICVGVGGEFGAEHRIRSVAGLAAVSAELTIYP
jgi:hypothetical protein